MRSGSSPDVVRGRAFPDCIRATSAMEASSECPRAPWLRESAR